MTRVLASPSAPTSAVTDGFGRRIRGIDPDLGDEVELLELEPSLVEHDGFVAALGERVARVSSVRHASYVHLRRLDRPEADRLTLVSDYTPGWRLSDLLQMGTEIGTALDITVVIGLLRQLLPAVSLFSRHNRDSAIGALAPERLIVTPQARLVIPEHAFGPALEKLNMGRDRFWRDFRIAMPPSAGLPRANARADANALGLIALSLVLGRNLNESEYPSAIESLMESATERRKGESMPLSAPFAQWIARALQFEVRNAFQTPHEAQVAFEAVLASNRAYVTTPTAIAKWVKKVGAAIEAANAPPPPPPEPPEPAPTEPPLPAFVAEMPAMMLAAAAVIPVAAEPEPDIVALTPEVAALEPEAEHIPVLAAPDLEAAPVSLLADQEPGSHDADKSWIPEHASNWTAETLMSPAPPIPAESPTPQAPEEVAAADVAEAALPVDAPTPETPEVAAAPDALGESVATEALGAPAAAGEPSGEPLQDSGEAAPGREGEPDPSVPPALPAALEPPFLGTETADAPPQSSSVVKIPLVQGLVAAVIVLVAALGWLLTRESAGLMTGEGELVVQSRPPAKLSIDGSARGVTPQTLRLAPGTHVLEVQVGTTEPRVIPLTIRSGVQTSQYIELQNVPVTGGLDLKTDPVGARVTVDGQARGTTPASLKDLTPGDHEVVVEISGRKARQVVHIEAGITAQLVVPIPKK